MDPSHSSGRQTSKHTTQQTATPPSIHIDEFDESYVRLWKIFREAIQPLFSNILVWVNPRWDQSTNFKDYLERQRFTISEIKKSLFKDQYEKLESLSRVDKWDITMIYALLQLSEYLAKKQDEKWFVGKGSDPELSLASLKNLRNKTAHSLSINKERCSYIINEVYELTKKIQKGLKPVVLWDIESAEDRGAMEREMDTVFHNTLQKIDGIRKGRIGIEAFEEYQRDIDFMKKKKLVIEKGLPSLKNYLEKLNSISPLDLITRTSSNPKIPVEKIFTEMRLEEEGSPCSVPIEDILNYVPHDDPSSFLLIKGLAGMGKSTLVKKIISDWLSKKDDIKGLNDFELLLHVECRDYIESFRDLLVTCLGDVHQKFKENELIDVCLAIKCLVIVDGYDELNDKSSKLFQNILTYKKSRNLSVIVTTRPEFEGKFYDQVKSDYANVSKISLEGIPEGMREEFIRKYYAGLGSDISPLQPIDELLQYLRKTMHSMLEVWGLPLNLAVATILWMNNPEVLSSITTEAELYLKMFFLSVSKLKGRLEKNNLTRHLPPSVLETKIKQFIGELCWVSFDSLRKDIINIPESTINDLTVFCHYLGVAAEELTGAFLKKVKTSQGTIRYSFPHKGTMEFMAAYYIFLKVTHQCWNQLSRQPWADALKMTVIPTVIQKKMLEAVGSEPKDMAATVSNIFECLHGGSLPKTLNKYQNMLIQMISIFNVGNGGEIKVSEEAKSEALEFLVRSGVKDKDSVLKVMKNIKFDPSSTKWIAKRFKLFDENTLIQDNNINAYNSLLRGTDDAPLPNRDKIDIKIRLIDSSGLQELSTQLCNNKIYPTQLSIKSHCSGDSSTNKKEIVSIMNLLTESCEDYEGIWSPMLQIPPNMMFIAVRIPDHPSLHNFFESLEKKNSIKLLTIHISVNDISNVSRPIPSLNGNPYVSVNVSNVKEEDIEKVGDILRTLQPQDARRSFNSIYFPRSSLRIPEELIRLLDSLKGVRVRNSILIPEYFSNSDAIWKEVLTKAKDSTGCNMVFPGMTSRQILDESDLYDSRLWKIYSEVICLLLTLTLTWVTPDWDQKIGFLTYLENKNVEVKKLKKKLHPEQLVRLKEDNPEVTKWDITLIYLVLRYFGGLADKDDTAWSSKSGKKPECLLTSLRDIRNTLAHRFLSLDLKGFIEKTEEIRTLMEKTLSSVGKMCQHVSQRDIDTNVANFNKKLNEMREADIAPRTFDDYIKELRFSEHISLIQNKGAPILEDKRPDEEALREGM